MPRVPGYRARRVAARFLLLLGVVGLALVPQAADVAASRGEVSSDGGNPSPVPVIGLAGQPGSAANAADRATPLSCAQGDYYTMTSDGSVYRLHEEAGVPDGSGVYDGTAIRFKNQEGRADFNALAVGANGRVAWSINRQEDLSASDDPAIGVYRWDAASGRARRVVRGPLPGELRPTGIVAGGINPKDPDAEYYFGGFTKDSNNDTHFSLHKVAGGRILFVGYVYVGNVETPKGSNGDLVFSAAGDMFILWNNADGHTIMVPVRAESLLPQNIVEYTISRGSSQSLTTGAGGYNGLAFDEYGRLIIQYNQNYWDGRQWLYKAHVYTIDPESGQSLSNPVPLDLTYSTDLASCASPSTLYVQKNVVGRKNSRDQFRVSVSRKGGKELGAATTSGTSTGSQAPLGPFILLKSRTYTIKETAAAGASLRDYDADLKCWVQGTGEQVSPTRISSTEYEFSPGNGPSRDVVCELSNTPRGQVSWTKTDQETGSKLPGSVWEIRPASGSPAIEVTDNTGQSGYRGRDRDPAAGVFRVEEVSLGRYVLKEKTAPTGYVLDPTEHPFELSPTHIRKPLEIGARTNRPVRGGATWRKVSSSQALLAGSVWTLTPTSPTGPAREIRDCVKSPCAAGGDQDPQGGVFRLDRLGYGSYDLTEKKAPQGYVRSTETKKITVSTDGETVQVGDVVNQALPKVRWTKTGPEPAAAPLSGSVWTWAPKRTPRQAVEVTDCVADRPTACQGPDRDPAAGALELHDVQPGTYTLVEKTPPQGYLLDSTPHEVVVLDSHVGGTVEAGAYVNQPSRGSVSWQKVDAANRHPLAGSSWRLTGPTGASSAVQEVQDCVADDATACKGPDRDPAPGAFQVTELPLGSYQLVESAAPAGYRLDRKAHGFTLDTTNRDHVFPAAFENHKTAVPALPLTGGLGADMFWIWGAVLGVAALVAGVFRRLRAVRAS